MNNITICAKYKGDSTTERGFRTMLFEIPPTGGKRPVPVPISLVPSFAAQDTCAAGRYTDCLLYTSPSPRDGLLSRMPSSA